jgi:hypothetical protein
MNEVLMAEAVLGRDAQDFVNSDVGRYILGRASQEKAEALEQLSRVSPWRRNRIRQLQNAVWRADSVALWIAELISSGRQAETVLEEERDASD